MLSLFRCRRSVRSRNRQFNRWLFHSLTCHAASWTREDSNLTKNGITVSPRGEVYYDVMLVTPSKETIQEGKEIVEDALAEYDKFYREGALHDIAKALIIKTI